LNHLPAQVLFHKIWAGEKNLLKIENWKFIICVFYFFSTIVENKWKYLFRNWKL